MLTLRTNVTPDIPVDLLDQGEGPSPLLAWLQPSLTGDLPVLGHVDYTPYGAASGVGPLVFWAVLALALYGAYRLVQ